MAELVREGKVKYIGRSEAPPNTIPAPRLCTPLAPSNLSVLFSFFTSIANVMSSQILATRTNAGEARSVLDVAHQFGITC
ncbi:hypothetical protein BS47DRAFT_65392 [Hydnum rufescens UP504]|uniref:Uncharacterized protein n=1 Tax=Hydnum rufescens UP504 TaxID=1448309 RepID=A0A9P6ATF1_9AGAM|nr:hypothetical protein BS47DRAFT_65392 [Hydnum rufescens UP504]